jgi:signal transduction histidine kinase
MLQSGVQHPVTPGPALDAIARSLSDPAFLASLCHDLRGPLGAIGTWLHVLGSERADAATREQALAAMRRDVAAQGGMIEQLSDLASLLGGTLVLAVAEVDLASLVQQVGAHLQAEGPPPRILADPKRIRQLLEILLPATPTDAATPPRAVLTAEADEPGVWVVRGPTRKGGPPRVGVTLARALAEVQGGDLAMSETLEGAVFVLRLPATEGVAAVLRAC